MKISYQINDKNLGVEEFLSLFNAIWPGNYNRDKMSEAIRNTMNITARLNGSLVGCVRILSDGYTFGTIPEALVLPEHQGKGIGTRLFELVKANTPTQLFFGAQPGKEEFYKRLGFKPDLQSFRYRK